MPKRAPILFEDFDHSLIALPKALSDPLVSSWLGHLWGTEKDPETLALVFEQDLLALDLASEAGAQLKNPEYFRPSSTLFRNPESLPDRFAVVKRIYVTGYFAPTETVIVKIPSTKCSTVIDAVNERRPLFWDVYTPPRSRSERDLYLFGQHLWLLEPADLGLSKADLTLRFISSLHKLKKQRSRLLGQVQALTSKKPSRKSIPTRVRNYVWERDGGKCTECGSIVDLQFDHIIPVEKGGATTPENLQILCLLCNTRKRQDL